MPSEPKRTINAKEAAADIRSGMTSARLMQKYGVSAKGLDALFRKLVAAGLLHENELNRRNEDPVRTVHVAWKCPACGAAQTREYAECPQCGVIVAKFQRKQSEAGEAEQYPESSFSQPSPSSVDAPSGGWVELETGNGRFSRGAFGSGPSQNRSSAGNWSARCGLAIPRPSRRRLERDG